MTMRAAELGERYADYVKAQGATTLYFFPRTKNNSNANQARLHALRSIIGYGPGTGPTRIKLVGRQLDILEQEAQAAGYRIIEVDPKEY